jgi:methylmalonyl-CoA mutase cobalamin-binding domain/chain
MGAVERQMARMPHAARFAGGGGFVDLPRDTEDRVLQLAEAVAARRPRLFAIHLRWLKPALSARGLPLDLVSANLECLEEELRERLPREHAAIVGSTVAAGRRAFADAAEEVPSRLEEEDRSVDLARRYLLAVLEGRSLDALSLIERAVADGFGASELRGQVLGRVQDELGRMWQLGEIHVGEEHHVSRITERALALLAARAPRQPALGKRVLLAAASGEAHDMGLRMVADELEEAGFDAVLLGADTPAPDLARALGDFDPDLVGLSATTPRHVRATARLIAVLRSVPVGAATPVLVGGLPFREVGDLWQVVGADGVAADAREAVAAARALTGFPGD